MRLNIGAQKLRLVLEPRGRQQALANRLGVDPAVVLRWAHRGTDGRGTKPNAQNRLRLQALLGIGIGDWDEPETETVDPATVNVDFDVAEPAAEAEGAA